MPLLIEAHYLPNIQYFTKFLLFDKVIIDDNESFGKQSYRNRCYLSGANGLISLIIPVYQSKSDLPVKEIHIDNTTRWQHIHWHSICSAYGKTAFFEHYAYRIETLYSHVRENLLSFNMELISLLMELLRIPAERLCLMSAYEGPISDVLRNHIHPKAKFNIEDKNFNQAAYFQAFIARNGFMPNLSILDLIFNEGPASIDILRKSIVTE
jgi:hypothetical protein